MIDIAVCVPLSASQMQQLQSGAKGYALKADAPDAPCDCSIVFGNPVPDGIAANASLRWLQLHKQEEQKLLDSLLK